MKSPMNGAQANHHAQKNTVFEAAKLSGLPASIVRLISMKRWNIRPRLSNA